MTRRCAWLLAPLLAGGCFAPKYPEGLVCGGGEAACPPGQSCDATGHCRARTGDIDAPDANDNDGDGVPDELDNCPEATNPSQADEDLDALGDPCDPCPIFTHNADGDGDGVGDLCDHAPGPTERIVLFEGFATMPDGWDIRGAWSFEEGAAVMQPGSNEPALLISPVTGSTGVLTVALATMPDDAPKTAHSTGPAFYDPTTPRGVSCALAFDSTAFTRHLTALELPQPAVLGQRMYPWVDDVPYAIQARRNEAEVQCVVADANNTFDTVAGAYMPEADTLVPAFRTRNIGVRVRWFMYVETVR